MLAGVSSLVSVVPSVVFLDFAVFDVALLVLLDLDFAELAFLLVGATTVLALPGVREVVQYHLPLASAQACPSLAVPYMAVAETELPRGSSNFTWPPLLLRLSLVVLE